MRAPVDTVVVSPHGAFGQRRTKPSEGACGWRGAYPCVHRGVDLVGKQGTTVFVPEDVIVMQVATDNVTPGLRGYGPGAVKLQGRSGVTHVLGHLDPRVWKLWPMSPMPGMSLAEGTAVGVMSSARHVHWEVRRGADRLDPLQWLQRRGRGQGAVLWLLVLAMLAARR